MSVLVVRVPLNDMAALIEGTDPIIAKMRDICYIRRMNSKQFFTQHDRHKTGYVCVCVMCNAAFYPPIRCSVLLMPLSRMHACVCPVVFCDVSNRCVTVGKFEAII